MALVASSPSSAFHMTAKPDSSRKKKRRRKRGKVVEDRRAEFVTRWRPETTFGYRSFEPGLGEGRVQVVSLDLQPQRTGEDKGDELSTHSLSPGSDTQYKMLTRDKSIKLLLNPTQPTETLDSSTCLCVLPSSGGAAAKAAGEETCQETERKKSLSLSQTNPTI